MPHLNETDRITQICATIKYGMHEYGIKIMIFGIKISKYEDIIVRHLKVNTNRKQLKSAAPRGCHPKSRHSRSLQETVLNTAYLAI